MEEQIYQNFKISNNTDKTPLLPKAKSLNFMLLKSRALWLFVLIIFISSFFGFLGGAFSFYQAQKLMGNLDIKFPFLFSKQNISQQTFGEYTPQTSQEQAIINAVKNVSPAVVSIIISKKTPVYEQYYTNPFNQFKDFFGPGLPDIQVPQLRQNGYQEKEIGGGTGVIISSDGLILTNKHVVLDAEATYKVFTNSGNEYLAKVLAKDPVQDLAIIKIEYEKKIDKDGLINPNPFPVAKLGDSENIQIGQTVIAIGNALGEFRNTVSVGVISGLGRTITATGGGVVEVLADIIQTDAAINKGNSGGPLLNLKGEVIGLNTAIASDAQSIGFAIPINMAKRDIQQFQATNKITYAFLGVRYVLINEQIKKENNLSVDYGALIKKGDNGEVAINPDSAAKKAGLKEGDVILEFNGQKITNENSLSKIISKQNSGDKVILKVLRGKDTINVEVVLGERS